MKVDALKGGYLYSETRNWVKGQQIMKMNAIFSKG